MKKLIDFKKRNQVRVLLLDFDGVFTDNKVHIDDRGFEYVSCSRYDGFGIKSALSSLDYVAIISTEVVDICQHRAKKLGIPCFNAVGDKYSFARGLLCEMKLDLISACYIGNDVNDICLLDHVLFPVVTPDCHPTLRSRDYFTTLTPGGLGCVRELCDYLVQ